MAAIEVAALLVIFSLTCTSVGIEEFRIVIILLKIFGTFIVLLSQGKLHNIAEQHSCSSGHSKFTSQEYQKYSVGLVYREICFNS